MTTRRRRTQKRKKRKSVDTILNKRISTKRSTSKKQKISFKTTLKRLVGLIVPLIVGSFLVFNAYNYSQVAEDVVLVSNISEEAESTLLGAKNGVTRTLFIFEGIKSESGEDISGAFVVLVNEESAAVMVMYIPGWVYVDEFAAEFSESIPVSNFEYVGNIINHKRGSEYAIWQVGNLTGFRFDSYIWIKSESLEKYYDIYGKLEEEDIKSVVSKYITPEEQISDESMFLHAFLKRFSAFKLMFNYEEIPELTKSVYSNMSAALLVGEMSRLKQILSAGNVVMFDLSQDWATVETVQKSGAVVNKADLVRIDKELYEYLPILRSREIEKEQVKVEVYNASSIPGAAYRYYRKIQNSGCLVVRYDNAPNVLQRTQIYVPLPERFDHSLDLVKSIIPLENIDIIEDRPDFMTTGDIVVVLGEDLSVETEW